MLVLFVLVTVILVGARQSDAQASPSSGHGASAAGWPASGRVVFDVLKGADGPRLGSSEHRWSHDGERYTMQTQVRTTGLADLLLNFDYVQSSAGRIAEGGLRPERFRIEQSGRKPEQADFDWTRGMVAIERKGRIGHYALGKQDQDLLSLWHLVAVAGERGLPGELSLVTGRKPVAVRASIQGRESVRVPAGSLETVRVRLQAREGKLTLDLWLSTAHRMVPVRILMTDEKGQALDQQAVTIDLQAAGKADLPGGGRG